MSLMMQIINDLTHLNRVFCSADYDRSLEYLSKILPFQVHTYTPDQEINGWVIPPRWDVLEAKIIKDDTIIYNAKEHPLRIIALSLPFKGKISGRELKDHLHYDARYDDAVPYHFRQLYRSWERYWGFCVTRNFYDSLKDDEYYDVIIETNESEGNLKILEYTHKGKLEDTILFAAHLDHPGMSNDDLAGCAVGVEVMKRLAEKETKYSYSLLLHQEIIGAEYYLANNCDRNIFEGIFLEMLGTETQPGLQSAPKGMTNIEFFIKQALEERKIDHRHEHYGNIVVNGEYMFAGYDIPVSSFSRFPYPEYHTDRDNPDIISSDAMEQSVSIIMDAIERLEKDPVIIKKFDGNICAANPKFDLYVDIGIGQQIFGSVNDEALHLRKLMELFSSCKFPISNQFLAKEFDLDPELCKAYLKKWEDKNLIDLL